MSCGAWAIDKALASSQPLGLSLSNAQTERLRKRNSKGPHCAAPFLKADPANPHITEVSPALEAGSNSPARNAPHTTPHTKRPTKPLGITTKYGLSSNDSKSTHAPLAGKEHDRLDGYFAPKSAMDPLFSNEMLDVTRLPPTPYVHGTVLTTPTFYFDNSWVLDSEDSTNNQTVDPKATPNGIYLSVPAIRIREIPADVPTDARPEAE